MEDKSFELLTKMYSEITEVKSGVNKLDNKVNNLDNRLIKLEVKIENDIERKLDLSLEGYKHLYEATSEIKEDIKDIKDTLCKHELSIFALNQK